MKWFGFTLVLWGCAGTASVTPPVAPTQATVASTLCGELNHPLVRLVNAGQEPRARLQYRFAAPSTQRVVVEEDEQSTAHLEGRADPMTSRVHLREVIRLDILRVLPDDSAEIEYTFEEFTLLNADTASEEERSDFELSRARSTGAHGTVRVSASGLATDVVPFIPAGTNERDTESFHARAHQVQQIWLAMPDDPVGAGAYWEVCDPYRVARKTINHVWKFTLSAIAGGSARLNVRTETHEPDPWDFIQNVTVSNLVYEAEGDADFRLNDFDLDEHFNVRHSSHVMLSGPHGERAEMVQSSVNALRVSTSPAAATP
ncbi:MAG: hypothetical protein IPK60_01815 [Sandaracinaceae bacterium]|nr:hypothetical protein [Sandaracinaceae bacterium]